MISRFIGCVLFIIGTCIGAGILALPIVTAAGDLTHIILLFIGVWLLMTIAAFYLLEVSFVMPKGTNLVTMAKNTLGPWGMMITWLSYLLLLYSVMAAYLAGGGDLLNNLLLLFHVHLPRWSLVLLFLVALGAVVYHGIRSIDMVNRGFMTIKLTAFFLLLVLILPKIHLPNLQGGGFVYLHSAILVIITSFGYSLILPSLHNYLGGHKNWLRAAVLLGSLIPLLCYILWVMAVHGVISLHYWSGIARQPTPLNALLTTLTTLVQSRWVQESARIFSYVCVTTSFLGVSVCLTDFLRDGLQRFKIADSRVAIMMLTYMPPLVMVLFFPSAFIHGLALGGVFCVVLLMWMPAMMVWSLHHHRHDEPLSFSLPLKITLAFELIASSIILVYACYLAV